jgi:hypothetical protein
MPPSKFAIVVTTIGNGDFLADYCQQAEAEEVREQLRIIVIPDQKTPAELYVKCKALSAAGFDIACPTIAEQEAYLARFGRLAGLIPYNSDNRRNIGFLMALEWGCHALISLDDDNLCLPGQQPFKEHRIVLQEETNATIVQSSNGWFNLCNLLKADRPGTIYPRGFPYHKRHQSPKVILEAGRGRVRLNAGLWLEEPDVDAITRLAVPAKIESFAGPSVLLGRNTWAPINSQNTSLHSDLVPAYYFIPMGFPIAGMTIDRFGDIFSGYFCQACARHLDYAIRVGTPMARHHRNSHNLLKDLSQEMACIWILEDFVEWLTQVKLQGNTCTEAYLSLADKIDYQIPKFTGFIWTDETRQYFRHVTFCMQQWIAACQSISR